MNHQTIIKTAVVVTGIFVAVPLVNAQGIGLRELQDMMTSTPQKVERGKKIWQENCVSCHGPTGAGDGPQAQYFEPGPPNLSAGEYRKGGGKAQVYYTVANGTNGHPVFEHLPYQDLWAVTHFTRSLGPTTQYSDPADVLEKLRFQAENGVCDESVKAGIADKMEFKGEQQVARAESIYQTNCASCHGPEGKGNGAAAAALNPKPRNFEDPASEWKNGTSPLGIFNTLANGIEGGAMASFAHLPEEDRWALSHMIRQKWVSESERQEVSEEDLAAVCRTLSSKGAAQSIPIDSAMKFLIDDVEEERNIRMAKYGTAWVDPSANAAQGKQVFEKHCQTCHGPNGTGNQLGPFGATPPYLTVKVSPLEPGLAGGTYEEFAKRSIGGAHIAIPDMTGASHISSGDWKAVHAYVASFNGDGTVKPSTERPAPQPTEGAEGETEGAPDDGAQPGGGATAPTDGSTDRRRARARGQVSSSTSSSEGTDAAAKAPAEAESAGEAESE